MARWVAYQGGPWATPDADYAAAFAQLHEAALWMLTLEVADGEVLDLTDFGLDVSAVATNLLFAGIPTRVEADDGPNPHRLLYRVSSDAIRAAGCRLVRIPNGRLLQALRFAGVRVDVLTDVNLVDAHASL